jgi:WD40 repeat protein
LRGNRVAPLGVAFEKLRYQVRPVTPVAQHAVSSGDIGAEHGIKVWDAATGRLRFTLRGHDGGVGAVTFSSDDRWMVSANSYGTIRYWDRGTGTWMATFTAARDGHWVALTASGFFAGAPSDGDDFIYLVRGLEALPVAQDRRR